MKQQNGIDAKEFLSPCCINAVVDGISNLNVVGLVVDEGLCQSDPKPARKLSLDFGHKPSENEKCFI